MRPPGAASRVLVLNEVVEVLEALAHKALVVAGGAGGQDSRLGLSLAPTRTKYY